MFYHTVKYLRWSQLIYRVWYSLRNRLAPPACRPVQLTENIGGRFSELVRLPDKSNIYFGKNCFKFLNIKHCFEYKIDWEINIYGKLWNYNLNYFEFINQRYIEINEGVNLIHSFIDSLNPGHPGLEPYPISIRGINLIKYIISNKLQDKRILESLYGQYELLHKNIEYHLLGNHLLENGLSLFAGGIFLNDKNLINKGKKILHNELEEQILKDGAHYERSPMYHQLILERILDVINILSSCNDPLNNDTTYRLLREKASIMLGWLNAMTFNDGSVPHFNDSTIGVSLDTNILNSYASDLNIDKVDIELDNCGYRRFQNNNYDCIVDFGDIGPDYQPGHAHSDTFSYVLYIKGKPIIVDTGISTYEASYKRLSEKRTSAHNTYQLSGSEQTEVWSSFRVARRAHCRIKSENKDYIKAEHTGYKHLGIYSSRTLQLNNTGIIICDELVNSNNLAEGFIHFHPDIDITVSGNLIESDIFSIEFDNHCIINKKSYEYSEGFNNLKHAVMVELQFYQFMKYEIRVNGYQANEIQE